MNKRLSLYLLVVYAFRGPITLGAESVRVDLEYSYSGTPVVPEESQEFCLQLDSVPEELKENADTLRRSCIQAANLKGFRLNGQSEKCRSIKLKIGTSDRDGKTLKRADFQFIGAETNQPSLRVRAEFVSSNSDFTKQSMIALCRAVFHRFPLSSRELQLQASADLNPDGGSDGARAPAPLDGTGAYLTTSWVINGAGIAGGYYMNERWAAEVSTFGVTDSLNLDASSLRLTTIRAKYFHSRSHYFSIGLARQDVKFDDHYSVDSDGKIWSSSEWNLNGRPSGRKELRGGIATQGVEASLGTYFTGSSLQAGWIFGIDWFGIYQPLMVLENNLHVQDDENDELKDKVTSKIEDTSVTYILRVVLGYAF